MNLKKQLSRSGLLASIIASIYRRKLIFIRQDSDGDFEVRSSGISLFSSSPFAWFDDSTKKLFSFGHKCSSGDNAIIVGVEDGLELTYFCNLCYPGLVVAIEPTKECVRRLKKLKSRNCLTNLVIIEAAASNSSSEAVPFSILRSAERDLSNTLLDFDSKSLRSVEYVSAIRLSTIIDSCNIKRVDYLKVNVEGSELLVLEGLEDYTGEVRNICLSCHDFICPALRTYDKAYSWLMSRGYQFKIRDISLLRPWENYYIFASKAV